MVNTACLQAAAAQDAAEDHSRGYRKCQTLTKESIRTTQIKKTQKLKCSNCKDNLTAERT